jgi:type II secretory pathway component PulK
MLARAPRTVAEIDAEIGAVGVLRGQTEETARKILENHGRAQQGSLLRRGLEDIAGDAQLPAVSRQAAQQVLEELDEWDRVRKQATLPRPL